VLLQLVFVIEHADEVFQLLEDIQVSVASTFVPSKHPGRAKPIMHSVYNKLHALHSKLQHLADSKCLQSATELQLTRKNKAGKSKYDVCDSFLDVVQAAAAKLWKDVGKNMVLAKQARLLDPRLLGTLPEDTGEYGLVFPPHLQSEIVQSGQWHLYRESVARNTPKFDILEWWEGMSLRLPLLYPHARRILAIPHTSCDVERSFSVWKRVRSDKQQSMKLGTHKAYVSFCFNGVVPAPQTV